MYVPALVVLALLAALAGALVEWGVNALLHTAFGARVLGLTVFGVLMFAGAAGPFKVYLGGR